MSVLTKVAIVKVQSDVRSPYQGTNDSGRDYTIVSFVGDGRLYVGTAGIAAALTGDAAMVEQLNEGQDYCQVHDLNISRFQQHDDTVFPIICNLRRGQLVRVTMESEHVIGNQRKIWRDNVVSVELVADGGKTRPRVG